MGYRQLKTASDLHWHSVAIERAEVTIQDNKRTVSSRADDRLLKAVEHL